MLDALLPQQLDNSYRGHRLALWLFGATLLLRALCGANSALNGAFVARVSEGIPLEGLTTAGQQALVALLGLRGLLQLLLCAIGILALVRYRAMVPLLFVLVLFEAVGRMLITRVTPLAPAGIHPATALHIAVLLLGLIGLPLALWPRDRLAAVDAEGARQVGHGDSVQHQPS